MNGRERAYELARNGGRGDIRSVPPRYGWFEDRVGPRTIASHIGGTVVKKELRGETLHVDTGCLAAFSPGIDYSIERAGNLKSMFFGGEGLFLATLRGTGTVYLQSLPFSRMCNRILAHAPRAGGSRKGEGSVLGGLGDLIGGR